MKTLKDSTFYVFSAAVLTTKNNTFLRSFNFEGPISKLYPS